MEQINDFIEVTLSDNKHKMIVAKKLIEAVEDNKEGCILYAKLTGYRDAYFWIDESYDTIVSLLSK